MMIRAPWLPMGGRSTTAMTELVDMYFLRHGKLRVVCVCVCVCLPPPRLLVTKRIFFVPQVPDGVGPDWTQR